MYKEKDLDKIIEAAFKNSSEFSGWFLSKTKFNNLEARCVWSRSDSPWANITFTHKDQDSGEKTEISRDSETDILIVMESATGKRFALHIENKLASGSFTLYQPEMYAHRAVKWANQKRYGGYTDFETILIAPWAFYKKNIEGSSIFDSYISYEDASVFIPELKNYC